MKCYVRLGFVLLIGTLTLTACNFPASGQGPMTWIDRPLNGEGFPIEAIVIQAHAADADGIAKIEFLVFDDLINSVSSGGARLEEASIEWMPPGPGVYQLNIRAVDTQGNSNARSMASVQITIGSTPTPASALGLTTGTPAPAGEVITTTPTPTATTATMTITPSVTSEQITTGPSISFSQNVNCRKGPGTAYELVDVFIQGQMASIEGRNAESTWLWVLRPAGSGHCWVSAIVGNLIGEWSGVPVVAAPPSPVIVTTTLLPAPPPPDTTPPAITNVSINPGNISQKGCGSPDTLTVNATVTDESSGVANVTYELYGPGPMDGGEGYLLPAGGVYPAVGDLYQAVIGPIAGSTGTWTLYLHSSDMANNPADAGPWTFNVLCIQ